MMLAVLGPSSISSTAPSITVVRNDVDVSTIGSGAASSAPGGRVGSAGTPALGGIVPWRMRGASVHGSNSSVSRVAIAAVWAGSASRST